MTFNLALAAPAALARLRTATDEQLTSLAYGETAPVPLLADVPAWLAEAAYDELDRRQFG
ncbi:hypothetical protein BH09PSE1_BH09PSE1_09300 [soil metagenome]